MQRAPTHWALTDAWHRVSALDKWSHVMGMVLPSRKDPDDLGPCTHQDLAHDRAARNMNSLTISFQISTLLSYFPPAEGNSLGIGPFSNN